MADSVINNFLGGLNKDNSFLLQPDGTYRNLKNGMIISHDGNHFTLELSQGNKVLFTLPTRYLSNLKDENTLDKAPMPIGFISFIDKLIVFHTNDENSTGGYGEIGMVSFTKINNDFTADYTPLYHHIGLNFTKKNQISGFAFRENENTQRVYWTDNLNEPRVLDIANPIFTTYIGPLGLVAGKTYMVLEGIIEHNDTFTIAYHGPSSDPTSTLEAIPYVNSNIFVAAGPLYTAITPTVKVIEYYPIELLDWTPSRALGGIKFIEYGSGQKPYGSSMYFYKLTSTDAAYSTTWSSPSYPIHIGGDNIASALTGNAYRDFVGVGTDTTIEISDKSIKLEITNIDTNFDVIELACIEYNQKTDVPYTVSIVAKENITGNTMTLEDVGNRSLGDLTTDDLTFFPASILKVKTITTNKNYNVIANITEREEFELDLSGVVLEALNYPIFEHDDPYFCTNGNIPADVSPTLNANPIATDIKPWERFLVTDVSGGDIEYPAGSGDFYTLGEVFVGVSGSSNVTIPVGSQCRPCTTRNRYDNQTTGKRVDDAIELKTGFWNYKDPAVSSHNRGYWSGEKYRFGILFFDLKGNPYYVKHLGDFDFPNITDKGGLMFSEAYGSKFLYYLNPTGLNIKNLDIPTDIIDKISGFSIVRAERDKRIITQGLMMQNVLQTYNAVGAVRPISTVIADVSDDGFSTLEANGIYTYLCPDELVSYEFETPIGLIGQKMEEAAWFIPYNFSAQDQSTSPMPFPYYNRLEAEFNGYSKLINVVPEDADSPRKFEVLNLNGVGFARILENGAINSVIGTNPYYNEAAYTNVSLYNILNDQTCSGGPLVTDRRSIGCKKIVFTADVKHYNSIYDYGSVNEWQNIHKLLANCTTGKDPNSQYGGTSEAALANTLYMSTGHYQPITAQVKADTLNSGVHTFTNIEIFGGDCFTTFVDIGYSLWDKTLVVGGTAPWSYALWFPCESNANYYLRRGVKVSNKDMYTSFGGGSNVDGLQWNGASTILEGYSYNKGYSSEGDIIQYPALPFNYKFTGKFEYRTRWAGLKLPGEAIDIFRTFRIPDYRDVDGQKGQINNVASKDSRTFYFQDHAVGYLPINERQLVGGGAVGEATALGVTGVIDRYEEINTYFGNQHQHGLTETEYGFFWFDMRRRALCIMQTSGEIQEISLAKGLQVFFNNEFNEGTINLTGDNDIYNTNNSYNDDTPLMGWGITGVYDPRFKMSYLTFKYKDENIVGMEIRDELISIVNKDFTIGYCHTVNIIVGFYDFTPAIWHNHNDLVLSSNDKKNTSKYYGPNMDDTDFVVGDIIAVDSPSTDYSLTGEYVCIKDVNIPAYPPITAKDPLTPSSIYWVKANDQAQVYLQSFNTQYLKFYGIVRNFELEIIVNPKTDMAMSYQNMQVKGLGPNFTDVYCDTDNQSASDVNIPSTSIMYRWIDSAWFSNFPLDLLRGRLTDYYLKVKMVYKGYATNPTVSKNTNKVVQWIKTFFIPKR